MSRDGGLDTGAASAATDAAVMREMRLQRNLKILVIGLGLMIFAALGAIAIRMVYLASGRGTPASKPAVTMSPVAQGATLPLELPKGARVISISVSGNRLAIHHESPAGTAITVIDTDTGARLIDVRPLEAPPGAAAP